MPSIQVTALVAVALDERRGAEPIDVFLRGLLGLPQKNGRPESVVRASPPPPFAGARRSRQRVAERSLSSRIEENSLVLQFAGDSPRAWPLPNKDDKKALRGVRDSAIEFARTNGATVGQLNAVRKALTDHGYHLYR